MRFVGFFYEKAIKAVKRPQLIASALRSYTLMSLRYFSTLRLRLRIGKFASTTNGFKKREYSDYEDYLAHQKDKLERINLSDYDITYRNALRDRMEKLNVLGKGQCCTLSCRTHRNRGKVIFRHRMLCCWNRP